CFPRPCPCPTSRSSGRARARGRRLLLVELPLDEPLERLHRLRRVLALGAHVQRRAGLRGEHHEPEDALPVHVLPVLHDPDVALEAVRRLGEERRGPGVEPVLVLEDEVLFGDHWRRRWLEERLQASGSGLQGPRSEARSLEPRAWRPGYLSSASLKSPSTSS